MLLATLLLIVALLFFFLLFCFCLLVAIIVAIGIVGPQAEGILHKRIPSWKSLTSVGLWCCLGGCGFVHCLLQKWL